MNTGRYTLSELLFSSEIERIIIPELQRDYVWGTHNVRGLMMSVLENFNNRKMLSLEIKTAGSGQEIEDEIKKYLVLEYNKLHSNTRIGFIYAYHDKEYAEQFFLIDGQQRLTTMYLSLLAAYKIANKTADFRKRYFNNDIPKIDYQVREISHDFLIDFINHELSSDDDFTENCRFYSAYTFDKTAKTLLANYNFIKKFLEERNVDATMFAEYLENYVEFNYFDTNLSEQGERLYLFMNSRGEGLSGQEVIKSTVIGRCAKDEKLKAGEDWEEWQDFFWTHRNRLTRSNADPGFAEFLKWAVILQMNTADNLKLKERKDKQTQREQLADYIRKGVEDQSYWINLYIRENECFDMFWLRKVMGAVKSMLAMLQKMEGEGTLTRSFLYTVERAIDYPKILGTLLFAIFNPDCSLEELYRTWMYLKNYSFGYDARRNPDDATITALRFIKWLNDNDVSKVWDANSIQSEFENDEIFNKKDERFKLISQTDNEDASKAWEKFFWSVTNDSILCRFLRGNLNFVVCLADENPTVEDVEHITHLFKDKIVSHKNDTALRRGLLEYGDISIYDDGGSGNLGGPWMERYNLLGNDTDDTNWHVFMYGKTRRHDIVRNYLLNLTENKTNDQVLLAISEGLDYITNFKYLWYDKEDCPVKERCILLSQSQAKPNLARELPIHMLHRRIEGSWCWQHNFCVFDFNIIDGEIKANEKEHRKNLYLDIFYDYATTGGFWNCRLGYRGKNLPQSLIEGLQKSELALTWEIEQQNQEDPKSFVKIKALLPIREYIDKDHYLTFQETVEEALNWHKKILEAIKRLSVSKI